MPIDREQIKKEQRIREIIREELQTLFKIDKFTFEKHIQILDARNIQVGKGTGTKIGTEASQKIAFFGTTPVVQQSATDEAEIIVALKALGLIS